MSDIKKAFEALQAKQKPMSTLWQYYDGDQPLVYTARRLREIFSRVNARFSENWAAVVVDSVLDRLSLTGFEIAGQQEVADRLTTLWDETGMKLDAREVHKAVLVCGESFVVAWKTSQGEVEAYSHDPRQCHIEYDPENPRRKAFGAKQWVDEDRMLRMNLYYADRVEYYRSMKRAADVTTYADMRPLSPFSQPHPFGEVPVFRVVRERRKVRSEMANALEPQDAVNKLLTDMMVAAEFGAMKQRWVISNADNISSLQNAPGVILDIPQNDGDGPPSQVGEFDATPLKNYLDAIEHVVSAIAVITRTPKHYFFGKGGDPSGEALIAMEAPLTKKVEGYIEVMGAGWRDLAAFMLKLAGVEVKITDIVPVFSPPQTVQPLTQAQIRQASVQAGMPLRTALRQEGWNDKELADLEKDRQAEAKANEEELASAMARAQGGFDRSGGRVG